MLNSIFSLKISLHENEIGVYGYAITASAVGCVLSNTDNVLYYDRKYSIPGKGREEFTHYEPLYPLVLVAYQTFFWEEYILAYVQTHKELLFESMAVPAIDQQMTLVVGFLNFL